MNQTATILLVLGGVVVVILALVAVLGLFIAGATTSFESSSEPVTVQPPADGSTGVVFHTDKFGPDVALWSWQIVSPRYYAIVEFVPQEGCEVVQGVELVRDGLCANAPAEGKVLGAGTWGPDGSRFVAVDVSIDKRCFDVLRVNDIWPSAHAACIE
jgi:hypothetical protein